MADAIAVPRSILENHPQRSELFRIRIPALRCFGCRINSRLNGFWALGADSLDESLLVGGVSLRPFESGDQLGMGNRLIHRGFPFSKVPFSARYFGVVCEADSHRHQNPTSPTPRVHFYGCHLAWKSLNPQRDAESASPGAAPIVHSPSSDLLRFSTCAIALRQLQALP